MRIFTTVSINIHQNSFIYLYSILLCILYNFLQLLFYVVLFRVYPLHREPRCSCTNYTYQHRSTHPTQLSYTSRSQYNHERSQSASNNPKKRYTAPQSPIQPCIAPQSPKLLHTHIQLHTPPVKPHLVPCNPTQIHIGSARPYTNTR